MDCTFIKFWQFSIKFVSISILPVFILKTDTPENTRAFFARAYHVIHNVGKIFFEAGRLHFLHFLHFQYKINIEGASCSEVWEYLKVQESVGVQESLRDLNIWFMSFWAIC